MKAGTIISTIIGTGVGAVAGAATVGKMTASEIDKWKKKSDKHFALFEFMCEWMKLKQEGKDIRTYFEKNNYKTVAIYGMSYCGERLVADLQNAGIEIKYAIDKRADSVHSEFELYTPEDELPEVDVVVVTAITFFDEIEEMLSSKVDCPIISLEDVIYDILLDI